MEQRQDGLNWDLVMEFRDYEEAVQRQREANKFGDVSVLEFQPGRRGRPDITTLRIRYAK